MESFLLVLVCARVEAGSGPPKKYNMGEEANRQPQQEHMSKDKNNVQICNNSNNNVHYTLSVHHNNVDKI